ncbi:MAG TPA: TadE family protein [Gaiellaceae bacterium]|jgi:Flp pilus assembly protein TadG|nr:TadE family protein [Gaiellaceae bacterium]
MRSRVVGKLRGDRGVALVEFALILPVLALMLFGMLDFGKAFNYWIDETHLANEGARFAVVNKNPASSGSLQQYIRDQVTSNELRNGGTSSVPGPVQVCIEFPNGTSNVGDPVRVTLTATYRWLGVLAARMSVTQTTISGASTMRLEARPTNYSAGCA